MRRKSGNNCAISNDEYFHDEQSNLKNPRILAFPKRPVEFIGDCRASGSEKVNILNVPTLLFAEFNYLNIIFTCVRIEF